MAEFPALPLWTDAYLSDTRHLSAAEHGAYLLLMMEAWRRPSCSLPDDDVLLARLACCSAEEWARLKPAVMAFWDRDGRSREWRQKRLTKERSFVVEKTRRRKDAAAKRWKKTETGDAKHMQTASNAYAPTPTPTPTVISSDEEIRARKRAPDRGSRLPETWVLSREWGEWALSEGWPADVIRREADKFRDYWLAASGQKAVKRDWFATWRNWMRNVSKEERRDGRKAPGVDPGFEDRLERWREFDRATGRAAPDEDFGSGGLDFAGSQAFGGVDCPGGGGAVVSLLHARRV